MTVKRAFLSAMLVAILLLTALPVAEAQRPCAEALARCTAACNQRFGSTWLVGSIMVAGCNEGCSMGYFWCATSN
jgi:hypothetical protein